MNDQVRKTLINPPRIRVGTPNENPVILNRKRELGAKGAYMESEEFYGQQWMLDIEDRLL